MSIHAKKVGDTFLYRFWGSSGGGYYTPEMTGKQIAQWYTEYVLSRKISSIGYNLLQDVMDAEVRGGSKFEGREVPSDWRDNEQGEDDIRTDDAEEYLGRVCADLTEDYRDTPLVIGGKKVRVTVTVELVD